MAKLLLRELVEKMDQVSLEELESSMLPGKEVRENETVVGKLPDDLKRLTLYSARKSTLGVLVRTRRFRVWKRCWRLSAKRRLKNRSGP